MIACQRRSETFNARSWVSIAADRSGDCIGSRATARSATATIAESDAITVGISGPERVDEGDTTTAYTVSLSPTGVTPTENLTVELRHGGRNGDGRERLHGEVGDADVHEHGGGVADVHGADYRGHLVRGK